MRLDCIENHTKTKNADRLWVIIDYDNNGKEFAAGCSEDNAWYRAAMLLQLRVNDASDCLSKLGVILNS